METVSEPTKPLLEVLQVKRIAAKSKGGHTADSMAVNRERMDGWRPCFKMERKQINNLRTAPVVPSKCPILNGYCYPSTIILLSPAAFPFMTSESLGRPQTFPGTFMTRS